jgi:hypothetical protein
MAESLLSRVSASAKVNEKSVKRIFLTLAELLSQDGNLDGKIKLPNLIFKKKKDKAGRTYFKVQAAARKTGIADD